MELSTFLGTFLWYFHELLCPFTDVGEVFGIPKRGTALYHWAMSETLSSFLGLKYHITRVSGVPAV